MRRVLTALWLVSALAAPAYADCKGEVEAAFQKQRTAKGYRAHIVSQSDLGDQVQDFEYNPPDRMYRKVVAPNNPSPIEVIGIGRWAWNNEGNGWVELEPQFATVVSSHLRETFGQPVKITSEYKCLGKVSYEGKDYTAYQTPQEGGDTMVRTILVDTGTGLPAFNNVGAPDLKAKPIVREAYSYADDINVEPPLAKPETESKPQ